MGDRIRMWFQSAVWKVKLSLDNFGIEEALFCPGYD